MANLRQSKPCLRRVNSQEKAYRQLRFNALEHSQNRTATGETMRGKTDGQVRFVFFNSRSCGAFHAVPTYLSGCNLKWRVSVVFS